jgi:hypothetical protein
MLAPRLGFKDRLWQPGVMNSVQTEMGFRGERPWRATPSIVSFKI